MSQPGSRLRAIAARVFNTDTMARVVDPAVADLQAEGGSARGYVALIKVITLCAVGGGMSGSESWTADDRRLLGKTLMWSSVFIVVLTALQELPLVLMVPIVLLHPSPWRIVYLAPQALSITLTIGAALGIVLTIGGRRISPRVAAAVCGLACVVSLASFVNLGWIVPSAKQAYRILMSGQPDLAPDIAEMTLGDLAARLHTLNADALLAHNGFTRALAFSYHTRWALGASPLVYALLVLSLGTLITRRWLLAGITCVSFFAYFALLNLLLPWNSGLPPAAAAWSSNVCLLAIAAMVIVSSRWRSRLSLSA